MMLRRLAILLALFLSGSGCDNPATDAPPDSPAPTDVQTQTQAPPGRKPTRAPATRMEAARRVEIEALRRGAPGVTTPVSDPSLADEPGRSYATQQEALAAMEARERRRNAATK
jgi:hypothetical protein